jgi:membrane protease YdiL (CAAX protease family)
MKTKLLYQSILVIFAFLAAIFGKNLLNHVWNIQFHSYALSLIYFYAWWILPLVSATAILFGFGKIPEALGLQRGFMKGLLFSALIVSPMFIGSAIIGKFNPELNPLKLLHSTALAGFMEELLFRGFLFGILFRKLKWGFIPASLPGAVIFGLLHLYQGSGIGETLGIFMVTFTGALWFAWLYIEWDDNLWIPVWMHILMNLSWALFLINYTALGGFEANIFRIITIALSVIITVLKCKRRNQFRINKNNLFYNQ